MAFEDRHHGPILELVEREPVAAREAPVAIEGIRRDPPLREGRPDHRRVRRGQGASPGPHCTLRRMRRPPTALLSPARWPRDSAGLAVRPRRATSPAPARASLTPA